MYILELLLLREGTDRNLSLLSLHELIVEASLRSEM